MNMRELISLHKGFLTPMGIVVCQPESLRTGNRDDTAAALDERKVKGPFL